MLSITVLSGRRRAFRIDHGTWLFDLALEANRVEEQAQLTQRNGLQRAYQPCCAHLEDFQGIGDHHPISSLRPAPKPRRAPPVRGRAVRLAWAGWLVQRRRWPSGRARASSRYHHALLSPSSKTSSCLFGRSAGFSGLGFICNRAEINQTRTG